MQGLTAGERLVGDRLEAVLPARARLLRNVRWLAPTRPGGPARDGEIDVLIVHPEQGILVIEVKDGPVERDRFGRWFAGNRELPESPFRQAETGKWAVRDKLCAHPAWTGAPLRMLHAVAFPDVARSDLPPGTGALGLDAPLDLVIDRTDLVTTDSAARALQRVFDCWQGDGMRKHMLTSEELRLIADVLEPEVAFRRLLRDELDEGEREILAPTRHQLDLLRMLAGHRRASIAGAAGTGKTLVAIEKTRQLLDAGFRVLFVCFNSPLSAAVAREPALVPAIGKDRLTVSTFHELCRRLGAEAGILPPTPEPPGQDWFDRTLPDALAHVTGVAGPRWNALVIDEGQDLDPEWLLSLDLLLANPGEDVLYCFHDPAQALYRPDLTAQLDLEAYSLPHNCRNPRPIHELAYRFYDGPEPPEPIREGGREPEIVAAEPGQPTLDAVRDVLHRLVHRERVERRRIAVLTGVALEHSVLWRQHRFKGDLELWSGHVDRAGRSLGLPADRIPTQPPNTILCDTIHRFKGLEADVVILAELRPDDPHLPILLYVGASRARHHLVVVAPPELARRLERGG